MRERGQTYKTGLKRKRRVGGQGTEGVRGNNRINWGEDEVGKTDFKVYGQKGTNKFLFCFISF